MMKISLRNALLAIALIALVVGVSVRPENRRDATIAAINKFDGSSFELTKTEISRYDLRKWFYGDRAGQKITALNLHGRSRRSGKPSESAVITDSQATRTIEQIFACPDAFHGLESLITRYPFSEAALVRLGKIQSIRFLDISSAEITQPVVEALSQLENLEVLRLKSCHFKTDEFDAIAKLPNLVLVVIQQANPDETGRISEPGMQSLRLAVKGGFVQRRYEYDYIRERRKQYFSFLDSKRGLIRKQK